MKHLLRPSGILRLLVIIVINQTAFTQAPPIQFQHLSIEQGLSNNYVHAITQDKNGLIWIGTTDGLNRFDGYNVEIFRNIHGDTNSLPANEVLSLFTDSRGIVWIGTGNGLAYYDDHTNTFRSFLQIPNDKNSLPSNVINTINEDVYGKIWIGTRIGLCSFDLKNNRFQRYLHDDRSNSMSNNNITGIKPVPDGTLWITTMNGLNRLDLSTMKFTSFYLNSPDKSTPEANALGEMVIDRDDNLWTYTWITSRLECFNTKTNRGRHVMNYEEKDSGIPMSFINCLFIDKSGRFWVGNYSNGLSHFIPGKDISYEYKADPLDQNQLKSNSVRRIYQDRSGMIWVATNSGVDRFNPDESKFMLYRLPSTSSSTPRYKNVKAIVEDSSYRLWLGNHSGIFILDRITGAYTIYQSKGNDHHSMPESVLSLCCNKQGDVWVGTVQDLYLFDPGHKNFRVFYAAENNHSLASNFITSIVCDKKGDLLIGTRPGFSIYHSKTKQFSNFKNDSVNVLLNDQINVVFEDNRGIIWAGMRNHGLIKYDRMTGKLENFNKIGDDTTSLAASYVCSITQDHEGVIWAGTTSGLCRFNETTRKFTTFTEKDGLPNGRVSQLMVDDKNRIWMGTQKGMSMLNETRTSFTNYDPSDGLQGWEFSEPSALKTHDGYFCYGGSNGFNMFHPDSIKKSNFIPPVFLRRIMIFDEPLKMDSSYPNLKSLKLSYKQNFFSFEIAALNYDHPEKNQYAYQLIGFDKKEVHNGTSRVISYTNVPPGNYTLKVTASNNDGVWNKAGFELELIIIPPFWATWWFKTIVVFVLVGSVFLFFRLRENRIRKEEARQTAINKQIAEIKMTALRSQMNPHFIFNSLNSIQHFITTHEKEEALHYLSKFSKLIRKILENSRQNTVSVSNELELLQLYIQLEQLRFSNKFDYHITVDEKIDIENTEIPPLLIQPYIENAIQHGLINKNSKGDLWLSLERNNGLLICKIEDNGIGRDKAQQIEQKKMSRHVALGIKVTNERISTLSALLDYKIEVVIEDLYKTQTQEHAEEAPQAVGTRVTISIPVREET